MNKKPMKAIDITGQKFGKLTAIERAGIKGSNALWLCQCDCGGTKIAKGSDLRRGSIRSCGCLSKNKKQYRKRSISLCNKCKAPLCDWLLSGAKQRTPEALEQWREQGYDITTRRVSINYAGASDTVYIVNQCPLYEG